MAPFVSLLGLKYDMKSSELFCLALTIYFEARGESVLGQVAVGQVVMNRVNSLDFPNTICEVVYQPRQFSWVWDRIDNLPQHGKDWARSLDIAILVYKYKPSDITHGSLYYHTTSMKRRPKTGMTIGNHIFYK